VKVKSLTVRAIIRIRAFLKPIAITIARLLIPNLSSRLEQLNDWAQLSIYQSKNSLLVPPDAGEDRVVFFGDSITEFWDLTATFPGKPYINRGISGQTTSQMLIRLRADAISLKPKVILILAGINDIAGNTGRISLEMIEDNLTSISQLAQINSIHVVFASVLPIHDYSPIKQSLVHCPTKIRALNTWLKSYCAEQTHIYLDYYSHMVDSHGMLQTELSDDGVHPNVKGYKVMASLAETAIQQALN
jgi:lysophospholipase L1-like esterase